MRVLLVLLTACTLGGGDNRPVTARPPHDPDRMSSETLAHSNPRADTSHNKVFWRSEACSWLERHVTGCGTPSWSTSYGTPPHYYTGCGGCSTDGTGGASALIGSLAVLGVATRRRRTRRSP